MNKAYYLTSRFANDEVYAELAKVSNVAALSPEERIIYDEKLRIYRDNLATNQASFEEGQMIERKRIAKAMLTDNYSADAIAKLTGLTIDEVGALK